MEGEIMEIAVIEKEVSQIVATAQGLIVTNNDEETFALEFCKSIKRGQSLVDAEFDDGINKAYATHKTLVAQKKKYKNPLEEAEIIVKGSIKNYRLKLELERQAEVARQQTIIDATIKAEQEKLMKEAEDAKAKGDDKKADQLAVESVSIEAGGVAVASKAIKQDGMTSTVIWKGRVFDIDKIPKEFLVITPNQKAIDAYIKLNGKCRAIPGIEYYQDVNLSVRR